MKNKGLILFPIHLFKKYQEMNSSISVNCKGHLITISGQTALYKINNKACDLWLKNVEVVGNDDKKSTYGQSNPVFSEIFVECLQLFHGVGKGKVQCLRFEV